MKTYQRAYCRLVQHAQTPGAEWTYSAEEAATLLRRIMLLSAKLSDDDIVDVVDRLDEEDSLALMVRLK